VVVALALLAAFANAVASICQRLGVEDAPSEGAAPVGLVRHMVRRRVWLLGMVVMTLGYVFQAVALHLGQLNLVQPLMVGELVILVVILWLWYATPFRPRDVVAALATAAGLASFLAVAAPSAGSRVPGGARWLEVAAVTVVAAGALVWSGARGPAWWRAAARGAGASIGFALLSAVTKSMTDQLVAGWGAFFGSWQVYVLAVVGLISFVVMQSAFSVGPFAASQSALILVNPFVSIAVGIVLFGEALHGGALDVTLEVLSLAVMLAGALGLAASPLIASVHEGSPHSHLLRGRGVYARWRARRQGSRVSPK
jgi:Ca2+/Na+ antiporter